MGYELGYGARWKKGYVVCPLEGFVNHTSFRRDDIRLINQRITVTEDVYEVPGTMPWFPLIDQAHYANRTLRGITTMRNGEQVDLTTGPTRGNEVIDDDAPSPTDLLFPDDDEDAIPGPSDD